MPIIDVTSGKFFRTVSFHGKCKQGWIRHIRMSPTSRETVRDRFKRSVPTSLTALCAELSIGTV